MLGVKLLLEIHVTKAILITRPKAQSEDFWRRIVLAVPGKFEAVIAPLTEICDVPAEIDFTDVAVLVFSSTNAVARFAARWDVRSIPAVCVGEATAAMARTAGIGAVSAGGDVTALERFLRQMPKAQLLYLRGVHVAGDLTARLRGWGMQVDEAIVYDQVRLPINAEGAAHLARGSIDVATFFSTRTAQLFGDAARENGWNMSATTSVCISGNVAGNLADLGFAQIDVATTPDADAMLLALGKLA